VLTPSLGATIPVLKSEGAKGARDFGVGSSRMRL
jgi:hypothetical protein